MSRAAWLHSRSSGSRFAVSEPAQETLFRLIESYGDGVNLRCHLADNAAERSVFARGTESRGLRLIIDNLRPGDVFADAGATCGVFSAYAAKAVGPAGRVISIEPNPVMLARLRFNMIRA